MYKKRIEGGTLVSGGWLLLEECGNGSEGARAGGLADSRRC